MITGGIDTANINQIRRTYGRKKMPLSKKGMKIRTAMMKHYGAKKGKKVFYAAENKGSIKGIKMGKRSKEMSRHMVTMRKVGAMM